MIPIPNVETEDCSVELKKWDNQGLSLFVPLWVSLKRPASLAVWKAM